MHLVAVLEGQVTEIEQILISNKSYQIKISLCYLSVQAICVCLHACTYIHMWRPETDVTHFPLTFHHIFLNKASHWTWRWFRKNWGDSKSPERSFYPHHHSWVYTYDTCLIFTWTYWNPNSSHHAGAQKINLQVELYLQPLQYLFICKTYYLAQMLNYPFSTFITQILFKGFGAMKTNTA